MSWHQMTLIGQWLFRRYSADRRRNAQITRTSRSAGFESLEPRQPLAVIGLNDLPISISTGEKPQSKVWTHDDRWWSVLSDSRGTWLSRLDGTRWTPTLKLSSNPQMQADVKPNADLAHILLYNGQQSKFVTVEYDPSGNDSYQLWPFQSDLVDMALSNGAETATIDLDSTGRMWLASDTFSTIQVRYSDAPYTQWSSPITVASGVSNDDIALITALPDDSIAVMWSNQNTKRFGFRVHDDQDPPHKWSKKEIPGSKSDLRLRGGIADDHLNVAVASDGTLYAAVKTGYDTITHPKIALLVRQPSGEWDDLYHVDHYGTRPIVVLNDSADKLMVAYTRFTTGGPILYRESPLDNISFSHAQILIPGNLKNVTSTKHDFSDEVVLLASNARKASGVMFSFDTQIPNQPPMVSAGDDQTIDISATSQLNGTVSDDGKPNPTGEITNIWIKVSGPGNVVFDDPTAVITNAQFDTPGTYVLRLTSDDGELQVQDDVTVVVEQPAPNQSPVVHAGDDQTINISVAAQLNGSVSDDGNPDPPGKFISNWTKVSGPGNVVFDDPTAAITNAQFDTPGTYLLRLTAGDGHQIATDDIAIHVENQTVVDDINTTVDDQPTPVTLSFQDGLFPSPGYEGTRDVQILHKKASTNFGSSRQLGTDGKPDSAALLQWDLSAIAAGSTISAASIQLNITNSTKHNYELYALQQDWSESQATWNQYSAGNDWSSAGADGMGDFDPTVLGQFAAQNMGTYTSPLNAAGVAMVQSWVDNPSTNYGLIVKDYVNATNRMVFSSRETSTASLHPKLVVSYLPGETPTNEAPDVHAGEDQTINASVLLNGIVSDDGYPNSPGEVTSNWTKVSGPGNIVFDDPTNVVTNAQFDTAGTYVLRLTSNDGELQSQDDVTVIVDQPVPNQPPVVSAGDNQTIRVSSLALLNGSVSDDGYPNPPGEITNSWTKVSGPGNVVFGNSQTVITNAQFDTPGTYVLRLTSDDGKLQVQDDVTVVVEQPAPNQSPVVHAGDDQTINISVAAQLNGSVSDDGNPDPPGKFISNWTKVSGPGNVVFDDPTAAITNALFDTPGTYLLRLTAGDGQQITADDIAIQVENTTLSDSRVGHWPLDTIHLRSVSDISGTGNHGMITGNPQVVASPKNGAIRLDGIDDTIKITNSSHLDLSQQITMATWVQPEKLATQYLIKKARHNLMNGFELSLSSGGYAFVRFNQQSNQNEYRLNSSIPYPTDGTTWMHIAATYDGAEIKIYINGILNKTKPGKFQIATNQFDLGIGAQDNGFRPFQGSLEDVRIYDRALNASEISALYQDLSFPPYGNDSTLKP